MLVFSAVPGLAAAQATSPCHGPADIEKAIATHPTAAAYDALGAHFASEQKFGCAISAFESAVKLDPGSWQGHYNLGVALFTSGKAQRAAVELSAASKLNPGTEQILLPLGFALSKTGKNDEAIQVFQQILEKDPQSVKALDGLTKAYIEEKRYTAAIAALKNAPADEVLQLNLAIAYSKNGDTDSALKTMQAIVQEHPDYAQAHFNLGIVYTQLDRFGEAAPEFAQALRIDPSDDVTRVSYLKALVVLAQFDKAQPVVSEYLQRKPHDFDALYLSGVVNRGLGNYTDAEKELRAAVRMKPADFDASYNLGFVLAHEGKAAEAKPILEQALKVQPNSSKARFQLANVLRTLGDAEESKKQLALFEKEKAAEGQEIAANVTANQGNQDLETGDAQTAVAKYRDAITKDPNNARTYYNLALALDKTGDESAEHDALIKAEQLDANLAPVHNQLGMLALKANRAAEAEKEFKTAISIDPEYAEAQNNLGVLYGQTNRGSEAEELFRKATENNPKYAQAFANLGIILASEGSFADSAQALDSATKLEPNNPASLSAYAMVLVRLNRSSEAMPLFRKVVTLDPKSVGAHLNLGIALADGFDLNGALAEFSTAAQLDPQSAMAHYNKGRVLLDLQRNTEAKPELETAVKLDAGQADAWYLLGLIARQAGETDTAIATLRKSIQARPDNAEAEFMLGKELEHKGDSAGAAECWRKAIRLRPDYSEALYSLARILSQTNPDEAKRLQAQFEQLQQEQHIMDRAQSLGNFALASADAHDWPQAVSQLKEAIQVCGNCSAKPLLHKDLGLIYCHSGDMKNGRVELLEAQKLNPSDADVAKALRVIDTPSRP
ncbi:tetratricopeptide repeat protein [Acidicapsa dinghuensis]|uniref:tetratricopeptide repeat protein n=1 Tax=Acidicapsa dinghuensis TaxID=2218256 RepID=UPI0021E04FF4|nr:tetratricopeptide repeat protein [Acidicapsa dinghuensis]